MHTWFERFTTGCARFIGRPWMLVACIVLAIAGVATEIAGNELLISIANTSISILTLLFLPVLQASQNRDGAALQAKLDELIRSNAEARDALIGLEKRGEAEIERLRSCEDGEGCD